MSSAAISNFEKLLASGKDSALLRFGLGNEYLKAGDAGMAMGHLREAVRQDASYSAAWKLLGRALTELGQFAEAHRRTARASRRQNARVTSRLPRRC